MKNKFIIFLGNLYLIFFFFSSVSANNIDPKDFIQEIVDDAKKILIATNSKEYKSIKFIIKLDKLIPKSLSISFLIVFLFDILNTQEQKKIILKLIFSF